MPVGFQSFLPNGETIQIDGEFDQYCLVKSGYLTDANFVGGGAASSNPACTIAVPYDDPIVALRAVTSQSRCAVWGAAGPGAVRIHKWWNLSIDVPVEYFIFARTRPAGTSFGMQMFDNAGALRFDLNWPLLRIQDFVVIPPGSYPLIGDTAYKHFIFSNPSSAKIAACISIPAIACLSRQSKNEILVTCCWTPAANTLGVSFVRTSLDDTGPSYSGWFNESSNTVLLIDVTTLPIPYG